MTSNFRSVSRWLLALSLSIAPLVAHADLDQGRPGGRETSGLIQCESIDYQYGRCEIGQLVVDAVLERQLSTKTRCVKNANWGVDRSGVWVNQGCRGVFRYYTRGPGHPPGPGPGGPGHPPSGEISLVCESIDYGFARCQTGRWISRARLEQQLSSRPCIEGRTWGYDRSSIWVDSGCRARFRASM